MAGKLFIVGIGPGAPDLLTVRAAELIRETKQIFVPISKKGRESIARGIAQQYISEDAQVHELLFPMLQNQEAIDQHYQSNFETIAAVLREGSDAALLTLGDPATYSTSWPLSSLMREHAPEIEIENIPGITSYCHAAARAGMTLVEGNEALAVVSSYGSQQHLQTIINVSDTVVFLKTYKKRRIIVSLLERMGMLDQCVYISRCGLEGEEIIPDLKRIPDEVDYLSMIILRKQQ
ncbi:precorrin-2 C(20)-methyltransferase [Thermodesulfobacteriota bacterium]